MTSTSQSGFRGVVSGTLNKLSHWAASAKKLEIDLKDTVNKE